MPAKIMSIQHEPTSELDETKIPLTRVLGVTTAILLVAGSMIGGGIFEKIVPMAASGLSETWILSAWIAAGIVSLLGAFSVAGLAKLTTQSGGTYEYVRLCFGDLAGFLLGWTSFAVLSSGAIAAVAFIFSESVNALIPIPNPLEQWKNISIGNFIFPFADSGIKIIAVASIVAITWMNYRGIKKGALLNNVITIIKAFGIILLIFAGLLFTNSSTGDTTIAHISVSGFSNFSLFFAAMLGAFYAYDGFANVAAVSGEIKNPKRNVPIAAITGVSIVMILYVLINYAFIHSLSLHGLAALPGNKVAAIAMAEKIMGHTGIIIIALLIVLSTFGGNAASILLMSRLYFRMAQEKAFFKNAAKVHPVYRTPYIALLYSMVWSCVMVFTGTFEILSNMVAFAGFAFYVLLAFGLIKMKRKKVIKEKVPGYPLVTTNFCKQK